MNAFLTALNSSSGLDVNSILKRVKLETLQVNMGNLCNQNCSHCHVDASIQGKKVMSQRVMDDIVSFISKNSGFILDITGGAPELNPYFDYFVLKAKAYVKEIIVRSNLTVIFEPGREYLPPYFRENRVHLICSLPCYTKDNVDIQRGKGVFEKSIKALRELNKVGYAYDEALVLDLVYNPVGAYLPSQQEVLEKEYKENLGKTYGIEFNRLVTITNVPIRRFKDYLDANGQYGKYLDILKDNFNPLAAQNIMCRTFLSVGYDGRLYDCDFNQALGWALTDKNGNALTIDRVDIKDLENKDIMVGEHCLSCTAGYGSSCQGALVNKNGMNTENVVKVYYGKVLKTKKDLKTNACCSADDPASPYREIIKRIHPQVLDKFYGCGSPLPPLLKECTLLDLGCGTGRDTYIASYLAGEKGRVIAVDMTEEQLEIARKYIDYHAKEFGFSYPNVEFFKGYIENLQELGIKDNSVDVVISNCVINLSSHKKSVFKEIFRVLKSGGELYFSDIFTGRRMPEHLASDPVLYGECLGGALYIEDFRRILREIGCPDYRVISQRRIILNNPEIEAKVGMIDFYSMTIRAFKIDDLEDICEDYGQIATYLGTISGNPHQFLLDDHHIFITGKPMLVCGNTASMLSDTRYTKYFEVVGDRSIHYGPFKCSHNPLIKEEQNTIDGSCC